MTAKGKKTSQGQKQPLFREPARGISDQWDSPVPGALGPPLAHITGDGESQHNLAGQWLGPIYQDPQTCSQSSSY